MRSDSNKTNRSIEQGINLSIDKSVLRLEGLTHIGVEYTCRSDVRAIDELVVELVKSTSPLFVHASWLNGKRRRLIVSPLGEKLIRCTRTDFSSIHILFPNSRLSPNVELFERLLRDSGLQKDRVDVDSADRFNRLVENIRSEAKNSQFMKDLANYQRASMKNHESLQSYLYQLRATYSKLLVIRLDLHYARPLIPVHQMKEVVSRKETSTHREEFICHVRRTFPALVGYVWKTEDGLLKSYHHHLLLFFNGQLVREDETIGRLLGEYWRDVITEGKGTYWNCNGRKGDYRNLAIGMISHDDEKAWETMNELALYLTKLDHLIRLRSDRGGRCFGKGGAPKTFGSRKGRPRKFPILKPSGPQTP